MGRSLLLDAIRKTLEGGIRLARADEAAIASAWGMAADHRLARLMNEPDDCDAASLVALVFSADAAALRWLLAPIQAADCTATDADWIVGALVEAPPAVTIHRPDGAAAFTMAPPEAGLRRYVDSLMLTRRVPPPATDALAPLLPDAIRSDVMSFLRVSRLTWQGDTIEMIRRLFERHGGSPDLTALLAVLIEVLETAVEETAVASALAGRKRTYFKALGIADRFRESAGRHNMETLMMMGISAPTITADDARRQMSLTDRVSLALFGRTEAIAPEALSLARASMDAADAARYPLDADSDG